jgi:hypothetical protein
MEAMVKQIDEVLDEFRDLKRRTEIVSAEISKTYLPADYSWSKPFPLYYGDLDIGKIEGHAREFITHVVQRTMPNVEIHTRDAEQWFRDQSAFSAAAYLQYLRDTYADQDSHALKQITKAVTEMVPRIRDGKYLSSMRDVQTVEEWPRRGKQTIILRTWGYDSTRKEYLEKFSKYCNIILDGVAPASASNTCGYIIETKMFKNGSISVKFDKKETADKMIAAVLNLKDKE